MTYRKGAPLCALFLMLAASLALGFAGVRPQGGGQEKPPPDENHSFSEEAPRGKWSVSAIPDVQQAEDGVAPVFVSGISSVMGTDKWAGMLKVVQVKLTNRSPKEARSVRLGWVIITAEDRAARKPDREAKLASDTTPSFDVNLPAGESKRLDSPVINFIKEARPLIKDGALNGDFYIKVRVREVLFADGTSWVDGETVSFLKAALRPAAQSGFTCPNKHCVSSNSDGKLDACVNDLQPGLSCWRNTASCGDGFCICNNDTCSGCEDKDGDGRHLRGRL